MDPNSDLWPLARGRAACSRGERGTQPGPCCSRGPPAGHGGAWFVGEPWSCLGRGAWRGWGSPVPRLPFGAESSPAQLVCAPLARTPGTTAGSPPCTSAGQRTPPSQGLRTPDPTAHLGGVGHPTALPLPPLGQDGSAPPSPVLLPAHPAQCPGARPRSTPALRQKRSFPNEDEATADGRVPSLSLEGLWVPARCGWQPGLLPSLPALGLLRLPPG